MDAVLIEAPTQSDVRFLHDFAKRISAPAITLSVEEMEDKVLGRIIEERLDSPSISREEVMKILDE